MIAPLLLGAAAALSAPAAAACPRHPVRIVTPAQPMLPDEAHPTNGRVRFAVDLGSDGRTLRTALIESSGDAAVDAAAAEALTHVRFEAPSYNCISISGAFDYGWTLPPEVLTSPSPSTSATPLAVPSAAPSCGTPFVHPRSFGLEPHRNVHGTAAVDVALDATARVKSVKLVRSSGNKKADYGAAIAARRATYAFERQPGCPLVATTYRLEISYR